jgi:hypothetical protein
MTTTGSYSILVLALLFANLSVIMACTDCSSLANNDNLPQGDGPLLLLYRGEDFNDGPIGIPNGFVSLNFAIEIRSLKCPPGYEVILYDQPENMGAYVILSGDVASLQPYNFYGRVHSLRFSRITHPQLFEKKGYTGEQQFLSFGMTELPHPKFFGSLQIPVGVTVKLTTIYGPRFLKRDIVLTSDNEQLPFSEPVEKIEVSFQKPEL